MFWIISAVFILLSLAFLVIPLISKQAGQGVSRREFNRALYQDKVDELKADLEKGLLDQSEYNDAVEDLQRTLLDDVNDEQKNEFVSSNNYIAIFSVILVLPVSTLLLYQHFSNGVGGATPTEQQLQAQRAQSFEQALTGLEQRLQKEPNDFEGWRMLGQSYFVTERYEEAFAAYQKASSLVDDQDPDVLVLLAEASAFSNNELFGDYEVQLLNAALKINPNHQRALWYLGFADYSNKNFTGAVKHWQQLVDQVPNDRPDVKESLSKFLNDARERAGIATNTPKLATNNNNNEQATQESRSITVSVTLGAALQDKVKPDDTLFIYARAAQGPKMPLSLARLSVSDLPVTVTLSEEMKMIPNMGLSTFDQVQAIARISKSGQAISQPGDYIAAGAPVDFTKASHADVALTIDTVVE
jgi:cytochrome c-type biogenesis protein CcmH